MLKHQIDINTIMESFQEYHINFKTIAQLIRAIGFHALILRLDRSFPAQKPSISSQRRCTRTTQLAIPKTDLMCFFTKTKDGTEYSIDLTALGFIIRRIAFQNSAA